MGSQPVPEKSGGLGIGFKPERRWPESLTPLRFLLCSVPYWNKQRKMPNVILRLAAAAGVKDIARVNWQAVISAQSLTQPSPS